MDGFLFVKGRWEIALLDSNLTPFLWNPKEYNLKPKCHRSGASQNVVLLWPLRGAFSRPDPKFYLCPHKRKRSLVSEDVNFFFEFFELYYFGSQPLICLSYVSNKVLYPIHMLPISLHVSLIHCQKVTYIIQM